MAAVDRDTFIPIGTSVVKLLLIASGQGALATAVGEGAGLLAKFRRTLEIGGNRAAFAEKIADDAAKQLLREHQGISEADWHVAARQVASLIDQLSEKERLAAGYNWEELRRTLLDLGGTDLRSDLADESARQAFDWVLEVACQRVADCFTEKEALASILESVEEVRSGIQRLAERPAGASQTRAVVADHLEVVRDLAPDPLEDRERELAELETFVRGSQDTWYAMEASMISGKTALMSSFTLNPPSDVHIVSFFIRRMGGDGNDWRSFSFVAGAQLAEILGDEYTERVSEPASQNTEFRQLLRRAATACQSDKNPRPLVLVIDGVDEDSYYEDPDAPGAKSILSLLPRHLPEGVKLVTASRPNPRMPEDIVCNASRVVVSLKPSPIAQEKINQKDIETFFKSDLAVDIGAFLAACGGSLTVDELRQLIARRRHIDNVPSRDVKACVDHSPGRMLMRVNVGFGDRDIPAYTLGHDSVLRAVLREIAPSIFGENDIMEDEGWWAQSREKVLGPYRAIIRKWVTDKAGEGWSKTTPSYMLSYACFNIMHSNEGVGTHSVEIMLNQHRYAEALERCGRHYRVLQMIERECTAMLECDSIGVSENMLFSICGLADMKRHLSISVVHIPGYFGICVSCFNASSKRILDGVLDIDEPIDRLSAIKEVMLSAKQSGRLREFLNFFIKSMASINPHRRFRDPALGVLVSVFTVNASISQERKSIRDSELKEERRLLIDLLSTYKIGNPSSWASYLLEGFQCSDRLCQQLDIFLGSLKSCVRTIEDAAVRDCALVDVVAALARLGRIDQALAMAGQVESLYERSMAFRNVAGILVEMGRVDAAVDVAELINGAKWQAKVLERVVDRLVRGGSFEYANHVIKLIDSPESRLVALADVAGGLAGRGLVECAWDVANQLDVSSIDGLLPDDSLVKVVSRLVRGGLFQHARQVLKRIDDLELHAVALAKFANGLASFGLIQESRQVVEQARELVDCFDIQSSRPEMLVKISEAFVCPDLLGYARRYIEQVRNVSELHDGEVSTKNVCELNGVGVLANDDLSKQEWSRVNPKAEPVEERWRNAGCLNGVVVALALADCVERAVAVAGVIEDSGVRAMVLSDAAVMLARSGYVEKAVTVAGAIDDPKKYADALVGTARELSRLGCIDEALSVVQRIDNSWVFGRVMVDLADSLVQEGRTDEAIAAIEQISDAKERARGFSKTARALARCGKLTESRIVAEGAKYEVERTGDTWMLARVMVDVAEVLAWSGLAEKAVVAANEIGPAWMRNRALTKIVVPLVYSGCVDEAIVVAGMICAPWEHAMVLSDAAVALVRSGCVEKVAAVTRACDGFEEFVDALVRVVKELSWCGYIDEALSMAQRIDDSWVFGCVMVDIAGSMVREGQADEALVMVKQLDSPVLCVQALTNMAIAFNELGDSAWMLRVLEEAGYVVEKTRDSVRNMEVVIDLFNTLIEVGKVDDALDVVDASVKLQYGTDIQHAMINALVRQRSFDRVIKIFNAELDLIKGCERNRDAAEYCATLAQACIDVVGGTDEESDARERWFSLARSALVRSWLYGASVWDHFGILMRVAPGLATQLVDERILAAPEQGTAPESGPDLGPEGPGGDTGSYR